MIAPEKYEKIGLSLAYVQRLTEPSRKLVDLFATTLTSEDPASLPPTRADFVRTVFSRSRLSVHSSFWETLHPDDGFELWSFDMEYLLGCGKFVSLTSYSQEQLLNTPWFELFERDEIHVRQILNAVQKVKATNKPVFQVTPPHVVSEKISAKKVSLSLTVKAIFPVYWEEDPEVPACIVALVEYKKLLERSPHSK